MILENTPAAIDAPYYYGYQQGYYAQEGINLDIVPSSGSQATLSALEAGKVDFALSDPSSVVLFARNSNATNLQMIALDYKENFAAVVYNNATISKVSDLNGETGAMANPATSSLSAVFSLFAKANNLNVSSMKITYTSSGEAEDLLLEDKVQFIFTVIQNLPVLNADGASLGLKFGAFVIANYGVDLAGFTLVTTTEMIQKQPAMVQAFVDATEESFVQSIANPQAAVAALLNANPQLNATTTLQGFELSVSCCTVSTSGLSSPLQYGWMNPTDMQQTVANIAVAEGLTGPVNATSFYTDQFVQEP